jgi:hypothetical protein
VGVRVDETREEREAPEVERAGRRLPARLLDGLDRAALDPHGNRLAHASGIKGPRVPE